MFCFSSRAALSVRRGLFPFLPTGLMRYLSGCTSAGMAFFFLFP